jgi:PAS domain S-box-containing protein
VDKFKVTGWDQSGIFLRFQVIKLGRLKDAGKVFLDFFDNCLIGVYITRPTGEILYANKQIINMLGFENLDELKQRNLEKEGYINQYDRDEFKSRMKNDGIIRGFETAWTRKDGKKILVRESARAVFNNKLEVVRYEGLIEDITETAETDSYVRERSEMLEAALIHRTAQLEAVNKELEAFSYSVSHDLQSPIRHMQSFTELLEKRNKDILDDKSKLYLEHILGSIHRMGRLIEDLLAFSRVSSTSISKVRFDLKELVESVINEDFGRPEVDRNINWDTEQLGSIEGDPNLLRQAYSNLISNAVKYTRTVENARIAFGFLKEDGKVLLSVKDNGIGFDNKYADKAFEVFYRLHKEDKYAGSGVGLGIVKRIINRCGGEIWAEGKVNEGAVFYMTLPDSSSEDYHNAKQLKPLATQ